MKRKHRLQRLTNDLRDAQLNEKIFAQPDESLFVEDRGDKIEELRQRKRARASSSTSATANKDDASDDGKDRPLALNEQKYINRLRERMATGEPTTVSTTTTTTNRSASKLRDFWSSGEAGLPPLPPLGQKQLKGLAHDAVNDWSVGAIAFASERKSRAIHARRPLSGAVIPAVIPGASYNPSAQDHVVALSRLGKSVMSIGKAVEQQERDAEALKEAARRGALRISTSEAGREGAQEEDDSDDDDDDEEHREAMRKAKATPFKTKKERLRKLRALRQIAASARRKRENLRRDDVQGARKIAKQIDAEDKAREEKSKERAERRARAAERVVSDPSLVPPPLINGRRRRLHTVATANRDVIPPEQLPERMSAIPAMAGSAALDAYSHILSRNLAEVGDPARRLGAKKKAWTKTRGAKFDVDKAKDNVAEPRFAPPKWAKAVV